MLYIPKEFAEEEARLAEEYFRIAPDDAEAGGVGKYIDDHASDAYKAWAKEVAELTEIKLKEGIRI